MKQLLILVFLLPPLAWAQSQSDVATELQKKIAWQNGPTEGTIANKATIKVPQGYVFLDEQNTKRFLELTGNLPADNHYLIAPESLAWFSVFLFSPSGYISDNGKIDPDELLNQLKKSDIADNEERKKFGMAALYTDGWQVRPHYDVETNRLEWGVKLRTDTNETLVNYSSRLLGRSGFMIATLVSDPENLEADTKKFKSLLRHFAYNSGEAYAEFKQGDKIAGYGLSALVLGGAAAVATKKGFWAVAAGFFAAFWKILAGLAVTIMTYLGSIFKKKKK